MAGLIAFDSGVFIYILDKNPEFFESSRGQLNRALNEPAVISSLVYTETLAKLKGNAFARGKEMLDSMADYITVQPLDATVASTAAQLRSRHGKSLRTPDAIHLATAIHHGASVLITNDRSLARVRVPGIKIQML